MKERARCARTGMPPSKTWRLARSTVTTIAIEVHSHLARPYSRRRDALVTSISVSFRRPSSQTVGAAVYHDYNNHTASLMSVDKHRCSGSCREPSKVLQVARVRERLSIRAPYMRRPCNSRQTMSCACRLVMMEGERAQAPPFVSLNLRIVSEASSSCHGVAWHTCSLPCGAECI